jgi:hypothetical protein
VPENKHQGLPPIPGLRDDRHAVEAAGRPRTREEVDSGWRVFLFHAGRVLLAVPLLPWIALYAFSGLAALYYFAKGLLGWHGMVMAGGTETRTWTLLLTAALFAAAALVLVGVIYLTAADDPPLIVWRRLLAGLIVVTAASVLAPLASQISFVEWLQFFGILFYGLALTAAQLVWRARRARRAERAGPPRPPDAPDAPHG